MNFHLKNSLEFLDPKEDDVDDDLVEEEEEEVDDECSSDVSDNSQKAFVYAD